MSKTLMTCAALVLGGMLMPGAVPAKPGGAMMAQAGERPCGRDDCASLDSGDGQSSGMKSWENRGAERPRGDCGSPMQGGGQMRGGRGGMMEGGRMMGADGQTMRGGAHRMGHDASGRRGRAFGMRGGMGARARDGSCLTPGATGPDSSDKFIGK